MSGDMEDYDDPDVKVIYVKPALFFTILAVIVFGGIFLLFRESVTDWFAALGPPPANSLRGEWVGELDVPNVNDPWIRPIHKHAVIRFTLGIQEHYLRKYGGDGEMTVSGESPQSIEIKDLWPSGTGADQTFETGLWKVPYREGDQSDLISGGFEGSFSPGTLKLRRQKDLGYDMNGVLHKGTDQEYKDLVTKMNAAK